MSLIDIYNSNGDRLSEETLNLFGLQLIIPSPSYTVQTEKIDGRSGVVVLDKTLEPRRLTARFFTKSGNYEESLSLRDELYAIFSNGSEIYVAESKQQSKRWKVLADGWTPDRINQRVLQFDIPMTAHTGMAESVHRLEYDYSGNFSFSNIGNVFIDMREQSETEIEFKGASTNLTIRNKTTDDEWKYTGSTTANDVILLKGIRATKNGASIIKNTNKKIIMFATGWNDFEIIGSTNFTLKIRTRFYFI